MSNYAVRFAPDAGDDVLKIVTDFIEFSGEETRARALYQGIYAEAGRALSWSPQAYPVDDAITRHVGREVRRVVLLRRYIVDYGIVESVEDAPHVVIAHVRPGALPPPGGEETEQIRRSLAEGQPPA